MATKKTRQRLVMYIICQTFKSFIFLILVFIITFIIFKDCKNEKKEIKYRTGNTWYLAKEKI
jgi:hypothetical protein